MGRHPRSVAVVRKCRREVGAQSLEWIGLGSFVVSAMLAATAYARDHLGDQLGQTLVNHIKTFVQ